MNNNYFIQWQMPWFGVYVVIMISAIHTLKMNFQSALLLIPASPPSLQIYLETLSIV